MTAIYTPTLPLSRLNLDQDIPNLSLLSSLSHPQSTHGHDSGFTTPASSRAAVNVSLKRPNSSPSPSPPRHKRFQSLELHPDPLSDPFESSTSAYLSSLDLVRYPPSPVFYPAGRGQLNTTLSATDHSPTIERSDEDTSSQQLKSAFHRSASFAPAEENSPSSSALSAALPGPTPQSSHTVTPSRSSQPNRHNEEDDPFRPRQPYWEGRFYCTPVIVYYTITNEAAEREFESKAVKPITQTLRSLGVRSYCVTMTHAGFERETSVPVVVVVGKDLVPEDAETVITTFNDLSCTTLQRCFCFRGHTVGKADSLRLRYYEQSPELGRSIGAINSNSSFSLGVYFHFEDDPSTQWALSTHHDLNSWKEGPIDPGHPIEIQQPSKPDYDNLMKSLKESLAEAVNGGTPRNRIPSWWWESDIAELENMETNFASAYHSECKVIKFEDRSVWANWVAMKVDPIRAGMNMLHYKVDRQEVKWYPRDGNRLFVVGEDELRVGEEVIKSGRKTNVTVGVIEFVYAHVKLADSDQETAEFAVITEYPDRQFTLKGDSGAGVVTTYGKICGLVLGGTFGVPVTLKGHESLGPVFASYITPFRAVRERLEEVSGRRVVVDVVDLDALESDGIDVVRSHF